MKRVEIIWEDICTHPGWHSAADKFPTALIKQVGYLLRRDRKYITIVSSYTPDDVGDPTTIPIPLVKSVKRI